jgi:formylglycine-generating enzyme required for sulfatase activity/nitrate/TMAO reductase-like tetraheme cytochrome c subunit
MNFKIIIKKIKEKSKNRKLMVVFGIAIGLAIIASVNTVSSYTSTDQYCMSCHIHPWAEQTWKLSPHHNNRTGVSVHCVECHLPPKGEGYLFAKAKHGAKDVYGILFKDSADFDWAAKKTLENAKGFVYEQSCIKCHQNLFPVTLSVNGSNAHLAYINSKTDPKPNCINCHLTVGHYDKYAKHEQDSNFGVDAAASQEKFTEATKVEKFESFTEKVPGTTVSFEMVAIPGGSFNMGSPDNEPLRKPDEGPLRKVKLSKFWIGKIEVSWNEYLAFFQATGSQGRTEGQVIVKKNVDAITGPTPPWGAPDQGWGKGTRPAITMSWKAATTYCQWLSKVTGKKYRLPTEAEWEYACRGNTSSPYFFEGDPKKFTSKGFFKKVFGSDTTNIASRIVYKENSLSKTKDPEVMIANPFGLKNMLGNTAEFCSDYYSPDAYKIGVGEVVDPKGPESGQEHVIRGGSFKSDAKDVRSASRDFTKTQAWLVTDPQMPKSVWWYSDCTDNGFRVVCEADSIK